jgi:hypothetical protein
MITREEEKKLIDEWLEKNEPTRLPPDERIAMHAGNITPWFRNDKKRTPPVKPKKAKKSLT